MKTIFEANPHTGKPMLTLIAQTDQERSLMNQLCSFTLEERAHHTRLRIDRMLDADSQAVRLCIRKKTFIHPDILTTMGFRDVSFDRFHYCGEWYELEKHGRFFFNEQAHFFVDLRGTCRVWSGITSCYLEREGDTGSVVAQVAKDEDEEPIYLKLKTQTWKPKTRRIYCQTVEELEQCMKKRSMLPHERP